MIIGKLREFEYEDHGIAVRWHLLGSRSPIVIDPRIAFGAPSVEGTPTWILKGRWKAGENLDEIAKDFGLSRTRVRKALEFEKVALDEKRREPWIN